MNGIGFDILSGTKCWGVSGPGKSGIIQFFFGSQIPRDVPLKNKRLSREVCKYDAEIVLYVNCSWRLSAGPKIRVGSSNHSNDELLHTLTESLSERLVSNVDVDSEFRDLHIRFQEDVVLSLFNDLASENSSDASFWIYSNENYVSVFGLNVKEERKGTGENGT